MAEALTNIEAIITAFVLIVSGLAIIAKMTPTPKDDEVVGKIQKGLLAIKGLLTFKK